MESEEKIAAFTVFEMVAVIALFSLLAGILFPLYNNSRTLFRRQTSRWRFQEVVAALRAYESFYGGYPAFLTGRLVLVNDFRQDFIDALQGKAHGENNYNSANCRFRTFRSDEFNAKNEWVDDFSNAEIYLLVRDKNRLYIPPECFPEAIRPQIPRQGIREPVVIFSLGKSKERTVVSW